MYRLQDTNNQLLEKVKNHSQQDTDKQRRLKKKAKALQTANKHLHQENTELKHKLEQAAQRTQQVQQKYEALVQSSLLFEEKTRDLYKVNQLLQDNLYSVMSSI